MKESDRVLVGSRAAQFWFPDFREPNDWDFISKAPVEGAETYWHPRLVEYEWRFPFDKGLYIASPDECYTKKVSHAFWALNNNSWEKHMRDIMFFQAGGLKLIPDLYTLLYSIWEERHGKKKAYLNVNADEFFTATVDRLYDHDSIHASIAYYDRPMYERILRDGAEVAVDSDKFDALSYEDKLRLVREEVYATALERILIPRDYSGSPRAAYNWALKQTITSFSKGWFPLWIVLNYSQLYKPDINYVKRHKDNSDRLIRLEK